MHEQIFEISIVISESVFRMRSILHVDMNNFYASVECLYRPEIRNHPVAVAGDPLNRHGIILAKNMIAKKLGVTTGEAIWAKSAGAGAGAAGLQKISALFPHGPGNLLRIL